jgi:tRNA-splicing ligase RtcB
MGTLGSGNHYLEVQGVSEIYQPDVAAVLGLKTGDVVVSIHCGSRGLGHQVGTDYLREMVVEAPRHHIDLPDRELACAPINSPLGQRYLGAMRAASNCALANREIITHFARKTFDRVISKAHLTLLYDVSHNTCKLEYHQVDGRMRPLLIHRKGATRAFGPNNSGIPAEFQQIGRPVLIGGSMGTASYILVGAAEGESRSFGSACHGAGRCMSRYEATRHWKGTEIFVELAHEGILIRSPSMRGVAEEAPKAYKNVDDVVDATDAAGLSRKVARLKPLLCIKG